MINKFALYTILLLSSALLFTSCKKEYTCTCRDSSGNSTVAFSEKTTEGKASSKCDQHYNNTYGSVPFNDVSCSID